MSEPRITSVTPKAPAAQASNSRRQNSTTQSGAADPFAAMLAQSVESMDTRASAVEGDAANASTANDSSASETEVGNSSADANGGVANAGVANAAAVPGESRVEPAPVDATALAKDLATDQAQRGDPNLTNAGPRAIDGAARSTPADQIAGRSASARRHPGVPSNAIAATSTVALQGEAANNAAASSAGDAAGAIRTVEADLQHAATQANAMTEPFASFAEQLEAANAANGAAHGTSNPAAAGATGAQAMAGIHNGFGVQSYEATPPAAAFNIATPLDAPAWPEQFGQVVRIMTRDEISNAELRVHPAELGPIEVRLAIEGDRAEISFSASSAETRALLEAHMPKLREALESTGLQLSQSSVQAGPERDMRQPGSSAFGQSGTGQQGNGGNDATADTVTEVRIGRRSDRMVDVFA